MPQAKNRIKPLRALFFCFTWLLWLNFNQAQAQDPAQTAATEQNPAPAEQNQQAAANGETTTATEQDGESTAPQATEPEPFVAPPRMQSNYEKVAMQRQKLVEAKLPKDAEAIWLEAQTSAAAADTASNGTDQSSAQVQRLALWRPSKTAQPLGAVLIVHAEGRDQFGPAHLHNLAEKLPKHGWASMTLALPNRAPMAIPPRSKPQLTPPETTPPEASDSTDNADPSNNSTDGQDENTPNEGTAEEDVDPKTDENLDETQVVYQEEEEQAPKADEAELAAEPLETQPWRKDPEQVAALAQSLIAAAVAELQQRGQYNLVMVGDGLGATRALRYTSLASSQAPPSINKPSDSKAKAIIERSVRALILINPLNEIPELDQSALDYLNTPQIPTLDVRFEDFRLAQTMAEERKDKSRQQAYEYYIQRRLLTSPNVLDNHSESALTRMIRGFLDEYAKGVELK